MRSSSKLQSVSESCRYFLKQSRRPSLFSYAPVDLKVLKSLWNNLLYSLCFKQVAVMLFHHVSVHLTCGTEGTQVPGKFLWWQTVQTASTFLNPYNFPFAPTVSGELLLTSLSSRSSLDHSSVVHSRPGLNLLLFPELMNSPAETQRRFIPTKTLYTQLHAVTGVCMKRPPCLN